MLSDPGLGTVIHEPRLLPEALRLTLRAFSQNALSFSGGFVGGSILVLRATESFVIVARVGSLANVPI